MSVTLATHNCQIHRLLLKLKDNERNGDIEDEFFVRGRILDDGPELEIYPQSGLPPESGIPDDASELEIHPQSGLPPESGIVNDALESSAATEQWMLRLHTELGKLGLTLPERINDDELRRFYFAANGRFVYFLYLIMNTIQWRQSSYLLPSRELQPWSDFVFWHWHDAKRRPCLIIRIGLACSQLTSNQKAVFAQAVVSQVEYGVLHLLDKKNTQISVLMDCKELSAYNFPLIKMMSTAILLLLHYPTRLGCLYVLRLPSIVRVIYQTIFRVLKLHKDKYMFVGENHCEVLSGHFQTIPSFLGGECSCPKCCS